MHGNSLFFKFFSLTILSISGSAVQAEEQKLPDSFYISTDNIKVRFDAKKFYNMNRIEYKGKLLCVDNPGSHYGTVFKFPGIGFIGSGHTENEAEKLISVEIYADGKNIAPALLQNNMEFKGKDFRVIRKSEIKGINISNEISIKGDIIDEKVSFSASEDIKLDLVYRACPQKCKELKMREMPIA